MDQPQTGYQIEDRGDETTDERSREPVARQGPNPPYSEEVQRIHVEDEDRLAFRVGVNILTLVLIGVAVYLIWRNFFQ